MSQENVELVRRLWEAAERHDNDAVFALYAPTIVWGSHADDSDVGPLEVGGLYHGHDGVRRFFRAFLESFESFQAKAESIEEAGNRVVVRYRVSGRGKGSGIAVDMHRWSVYEISDGLIVRVEIFETEAEALEAAGRRE